MIGDCAYQADISVDTLPKWQIKASFAPKTGLGT